MISKRAVNYCVYLALLLLFMSAKPHAETMTPNPVSDIKLMSLAEIASRVERSASAIVVSDNDASINAEIAAVVKAVVVRVGEQVSEGDLLVALDCTDYELAQALATADMEASKANLSFAQIQYKRALNLREKSLNSTLDVDSSRTELASSKANKQRSEVLLKQAKRDVERCAIAAPFSGVIVERMAAKGELVAQGTPLLRLVDTNAVELSATVGPQLVDQLGAQFEYQFLHQGGREKKAYAATLVRVADFIESSRRSVEARFSFTGEKPPVGASGKLVWSTESWFLPQRYLGEHAGARGVFISEGGKVNFIALEQSSAGLPVEVDLPANTQIIASGVQSLVVGQSIQ